MKPAILAAALLAGLAGQFAGQLAAQPAASILFMTPQDWRRASTAEKTALAADFMRLFCLQPTMPPADLAACLDRNPGSDAVFNAALDCARQLSSR